MFRGFWWPLLVGLALIALACGGGGDDDDASPLDGPADEGGSDEGDDGSGDGSGDDGGDDGSGDDGGEEDDGSGDDGSSDGDIDQSEIGPICDLISDDAIREALDVEGSVDDIEVPFDDFGEGGCSYVVADNPGILGTYMRVGEGADEGFEEHFGFPDAEEFDVEGADALWISASSTSFVRREDLIVGITFLGASEEQTEQVTKDLAADLAGNLP